MDTLQNIGEQIATKLGEIKYLSQEKYKTQEDLKDHELELGFWEEGLLILQHVARETQQELEYALSELVTLAMEGVFEEDAYEVEIDFVTRGDKTEVDIWFVRDGKRLKPMDSTGLGAVDVAAFAFRLSLWSLAAPRSANTIILDEPFPRLKGTVANERVLRVASNISKQMGLQIIMVSDERVPKETIVEHADRVFEVSMSKGRSGVKVL